MQTTLLCFFASGILHLFLTDSTVSSQCWQRSLSFIPTCFCPENIVPVACVVEAPLPAEPGGPKECFALSWIPNTTVRAYPPRSKA